MKQENNNNKADDDDLFEQIALEGVKGSVDQAGAVVAGHDLDSDGKRRGDLAQLSFDTIDHIQRICALPHDDDSANGLAFAIPFGNAFTDIRSKADCTQIAQQDGRAVVAADCRVGKIVQRMQIPEAADHVACAVHIQLAPANLARTRFYPVDHSGERNAIGEQLVRVKLHMILLHISADAGDLRNALNSFQLIAKLPILKAAQIGQTMPVACINN